MKISTAEDHPHRGPSRHSANSLVDGGDVCWGIVDRLRVAGFAREGSEQGMPTNEPLYFAIQLIVMNSKPLILLRVLLPRHSTGLTQPLVVSYLRVPNAAMSPD
jgi:hypothetical protein